MIDEALIRNVRRALAAKGNPADAKAMQAYMKSEMPSHGVKAKELRAVLKEELAKRKLDWPEARDTARRLWDTAHKREERHVAIQLTGIARHKRHLVPAELPLFEHMIRNGAWWDYVDVVATHRLRVMIDNDEKTMRPIMERWSRDNDVWIRRASIISQLLRKERMDTDLLAFCIRANLRRDEFWLRKAIGWVLRHYARTDPDWVIAFVDEHVDELSPLSKKEALKHL